MAFQQEFIPLELDQLHREAAVLKTEGWRFIQTHAVNTDNGIDLYYSFMKDGRVVNYRVAGVQKDQAVPSITDLFLAAFVFENEARELFGVDMRDIAIDFAGALYAPAQAEPMTIITPEQKAAREKARKAAEAKASKDAAPAQEPPDGAPAKRVFVMTPERRARLDAKLATMSPDKVAKVEAALKAREAEAASAGNAVASAPTESKPAAEPAKAEPSAKEPDGKDADLEAKLATMDPEKAAKVRAALAGKAAAAEASTEPAPAAADEPPAEKFADEQLAALIGLMDDSKAAVVKKALNMKEGE
ncbi:MAG: NADH-quinone oxidoreductase subunit C [Eggerthellaceae bacterium]|nr:NADH-quinone oxidoreductase subunit C [Eggerthellaceae bacterium]